MKKMSNDFKVGLFVIFCVLGLIYLTFSTGKITIKKGGYYLYVTFNEIAGLETKAPVMLNGLEVGKVEDIKVSYDDDKTQIMLKLWLEGDARIRKDAVVSIKTLGLMGEKYIQISSVNGTEFIAAETTLAGKPYMDLDAMMDQVRIVTQDITQQVNKLLASITDTLDVNKPGISQIVKNLENTSKNFEEFSEDIKRHPWKLLIKTKEKPAKK